MSSIVFNSIYITLIVIDRGTIIGAQLKKHYQERIFEVYIFECIEIICVISC